MPNVPSTMGRIRARATCIREGQAVSGQTDFFTVARDSVVRTGEFKFGEPDPIPASLEFDPPGPSLLDSVGENLSLSIIAAFPDQTSRDVTDDPGINFVSSNPAIASISEGALVTAVSPGTALITARLEGAVAIHQVTVTTSGDSDGDGLPDDYELANGLNPNDPVDAQEDQDGDGLTALSEFNAGTDPNNGDSDGDTIADGEEVTAGEDGFVTNPLLPDSDGDGIRDALEIATGSDPTDADSFNLAEALTSLEVTPAVFVLTFNTIIGEASRQLTVAGQLRDGTNIDLTSTGKGTNYSSSDITICSFGAASGRVFAGADGTCTVTARNSGFSDEARITVRSFSPEALSFVDIPGFANNVDVSGNFAFVAAGSAGLQVVDVSNRVAPIIVADVDTPGNASDVKVVGDFAFVADGVSGLQIVDLADPLEPEIVGAFDTPGTALDVVVVGDLAFVADGAFGLQIVAVGDPLAPSLVDGVDTPGSAQGVAVREDLTLAVVADGAAGLQVVDLSGDLADPRIVGTVDTGDARDVALQDDFALVADLASSLTIVDLADPEDPIVVTSTPPTQGGLLVDVALANDFTFGADIFFVNGVPIIDVIDPTSPIPSFILDFRQFRDDNGTGIAVDGSFVYLTAAVGNSSRLYVGQYLALEDDGEIPPTVAITMPSSGETVVEEASLPIVVEATDDVAVASVDFIVDGAVVSTDTSAPYQFNLTVPFGATALTLGAEAIDLGGSVGVAEEVTVDVIPDPLTTVIGIVVNMDGDPVAGATVSVDDSFFDTTGLDGSFSIANVPTAPGRIDVEADALIDGEEATGRSSSVTPVLGGSTDVGMIEVAVFRAGTALSFDGTNDLVTFGRVTPLFRNTLEAWVKPASTSSGIIVGQLAGPGQGCTFGVALSGGGSRLVYDVNPNGCGNSNVISHDADIQDLWTHVAGTFDGDTERLYVNGQLVNERSGVSFRPSNWMTAGAITFFNGQQAFFSGEIDEIRFWDFARTAEEIQETMDRSLTGTEPGLVGYWRMDEGTGQEVGDLSPSNVTGILGTSGAEQSNDPMWVISDAPIRP
ncbi:MAG: Ig-like domain-containing protein [Kiloniellales bacterium]|nr:Ig-like domain-containing protein [Kiloniellales bacterium]